MSVERHSRSIYSRREFGRLTLAALPLSLAQRSPKRLDSTITTSTHVDCGVGHR